jgi:hypothetical protein
LENYHQLFWSKSKSFVHILCSYNESLIENIFEALVNDTAVEGVRVNELAKNRASDIIVSALKATRGYSNTDAYIRDVLNKMQES